MLKSMTAYAFAERSEGDLSVNAEIRSYNSRHLDVVLRLPMGYASFEERLKGLIATVMERGRVELRVGIQDNSEALCAYQVDMVRAKAYLAAAGHLNDQLKLGSGALSMEHLLGVSGVIQAADHRVDAESHWSLTASAVQEALGALDQMRLKEGQFIALDFDRRLEFVERSLEVIESAAGDMVLQYRDKLQARVEALTQGLVEIDPSRIAQEAGLLADRSDISEEILRAKSHIEQYRSIMAATEPAGRKLNFLLQEFNREFNTMGAKVGHAALAHIIVDIKAEIEKLREQVQNIE